MNQNSVKTIGIKDEPRNDSYLVYVNKVDVLKSIFDKDFDEWSNFDSWESISVHQSFFQELWRFIEVLKLILIAIVVNIIFLLLMILRILKKKNALVKKVLT